MKSVAEGGAHEGTACCVCAALWPYAASPEGVRSHCAFYEGPLARSSWLDRTTLDYFAGVQRVVQAKGSPHAQLNRTVG